jgi:hypothetical protein
MGRAYGLSFRIRRWVTTVALLGAAIVPALIMTPAVAASKISVQRWETVLVNHSKSKAEVVTTTRSVTRIVIEASGSAVKSEWSGVCLPVAGTVTRPGAGTTTTKPGTTSAVLPIQILRVPATKSGELLVTCSVAAYAVMMGHGQLTIKVQVLVPGIGSL